MGTARAAERLRPGDQKLQDQQRRYEESGLTVVAFCRGEGVPISTFYQRRARLRKQAREQPGVERAKAAAFIDAGAVTVAASTRSTMRSARANEITQCVEVRIDLGDGVVLHITRG